MPGTVRFALRRLRRSPASAFGLGPLSAMMLMLLAAPAPAQRLPLPPSEQEAVNNAIDRGVAYLKRTQRKNGTWAEPNTKVDELFTVGYTALPALTLLECGVPADDAIIQKAAHFLRSKAGHLQRTYELSLAILFLDRLGDPKDKKLIQTFALRLVAGQSATGGWGYRCPLLNAPAQKELLIALRRLDPPLEDMPARVGGAGNPLDKPARIARAPAAPPLEEGAVRAGAPSLGGSISRSRLGEALAPRELTGNPAERWRDCLGWGMPGSSEPAPTEAEPKAADREAPPANAEDKADSDKPAKRYVIPERVQMFPVVQNPDRHVLQDPLGKARALILTTTDNSNTQFAIQALWAAQRYEVPMKRTMNLIVRRFATSQNADGSWGYHYRFGGGEARRTLTMTCVGLIGLAVGHGLAKPRAAGQPVQDPRIINGLIALSKTVGQPTPGPANPPMENLYYLWSLERVAVLYNLPTIGDKDWYRWGAQILLANQDVEGNWSGGLYIGNTPTTDTCLALLFLKRANLVKDLSDKLPFTGAELNDDIMRQLAPPSEPVKKPVKTVLPAEPPKAEEPSTFITKPPPSPTRTPEPEPEETNSSGGKKKWIVASLILFVAFAGGSLFIFIIARRGAEGGEETKDSKPKKRTNKPKLRSKT